MIRQTIRKAFSLAAGTKKESFDDFEPVEFSKADRDVFRYVLSRRLTMASPQRLVATINACKHAVHAEIEGDFVECGVWRGGNAIAAKLTFENYRSDKAVWLFDTFAGMTEPSSHDTTPFSDRSAAEQFREADKGDHIDWCYTSLEDVQANFSAAKVDMAGIRFVAGDVCETLLLPESIPASISVLRLDTDFYESTKAEMEVLYPRLGAGGSLLIDDFGHWEGARRAVEEYLGKLPARSRPLLHFTDYTGRMGIKP